jgi:CRP-like cAMP-binding protein
MNVVVEPTAETLSGVTIFQGLDLEARGQIAASCQGRRFERGQTILHERDESDDVHFLVSGRVRATIFSASGKEVAFRDLDPGDMFGDLAAIDGRPRSANVVALDDALVLWMSGAGFRKVCRAHADVAEGVMYALASLVRSLSERVVEFSTLGVKNRIHAELLRLAGGVGAAGAVEIDHPPTHAEIASAPTARPSPASSTCSPSRVCSRNARTPCWCTTSRSSRAWCARSRATDRRSIARARGFCHDAGRPCGYYHSIRLPGGGSFTHGCGRSCRGPSGGAGMQYRKRETPEVDKIDIWSAWTLAIAAVLLVALFV